MTGTRDIELDYIYEVFDAESSVAPSDYDRLLADGWRHFGTHFNRYNLALYNDEIRRVLPLRVRLADFQYSKSQNRIIKKNLDLEISIGPISLSTEIFALFELHKNRFITNIPESIYTFISRKSGLPTELFQISARYNGLLYAISFFDLGENSVSAIYACFEPKEKSRSLGIFTMLKVIQWANDKGMTFYYPGYAYEGHSFYDYKKRFSGLEQFDWNGNWAPL